MPRPIGLMQFWAGCPQTPNSRWRRSLHLLQRCAEAGWRTSLVWSKMPEDPALSRPFIDADCRIIIQPRPTGNFDGRSVERTYRLLRKTHCDIFHCHNVHTSPLIAATLAGVPVRIWSKLAMSPYYEKGIPPTGLHRLVPSVRTSCALAHRVLAGSEAIRDELLACGVASTKVVVMPAPIDLDLYGNASDAGIRESLGLTAQNVVITTVGHAVPVKGWDILIRAFAEVVASVSAAHLLLVGGLDGPEERAFYDNLVRIIGAPSADQNIHFLGRRADIPQILAASDIFVLPSRSEGQPNALKEAMAAGLACIASCVGGIPELILHQENGLLFEREDAHALAGMVIELISNQTLRRGLGSNARRAVQRYGLEQGSDAMLDLYRTLLGNAKG